MACFSRFFFLTYFPANLFSPNSSPPVVPSTEPQQKKQCYIAPQYTSIYFTALLHCTVLQCMLLPLHSALIALSCSSGYTKLYHTAVHYTTLHCTALLSIPFILLPLYSCFSCRVPYSGTMSTFESNTVSEPFDSIEAERRCKISSACYS